MSFKIKHNKNKIGLAVLFVGVGILLAIIIPLWGWILAVGGGLICLGWYLIEHSSH